MNSFVKIAAHAFFLIVPCTIMASDKAELTKESIEMHILKKKQSATPESNPNAYQQLYEAEEVSIEDNLDDESIEKSSKTTVWQKFVAWLSKKTT
jgi:hypothetical protein